MCGGVGGGGGINDPQSQSVGVGRVQGTGQKGNKGD